MAKEKKNKRLLRLSLHGACAPAHAYGINYYIVDLVCQAPFTGVPLAPELCS